MKSPSFVLGYKYDETAKTRYFGPFVTERIAEDFRDNLPATETGGWARIVTLEGFLSHEVNLVKQLIQRERTISAV
jgi:hypothetical protein